MFQFHRDRFFADFALRQDLRLTPERKAALGYLLGAVEADPGFTMLREVAYVLATIRWETGHSFEPVREKRASRDRQPRLWESQQRYWRDGFYGRGYVQLTWRENYRKAGQRLAGLTVSTGDTGAGGHRTLTIRPDTFVENPDLLLEREPSYLICARGMREGWFTGKRLGQYIREQSPPDYFGARKVVNGTDQAERIAQYAQGMELLLRAAAL